MNSTQTQITNSTKTNNNNNLQFQIEQFKIFLQDDSKVQNTISAYISELILFFSWLNSNCNYTNQTQLTRNMVLDYKQYLHSIGNKAETINHKLISLKKYNEYLISTNQQEAMVIIKKDIIKIQKQPISPTDISDRDVINFLDKIKKNEPIRNYTIVYLIIFTGLRISEALDIKLSDIDFEGSLDTRVSCRLKPTSLKNKACLNEVPVSLPLIVASPTTQTTTPPCFVTRYNSLATASKSKL